jgi:hypothetical protein
MPTDGLRVVDVAVDGDPAATRLATELDADTLLLLAGAGAGAGGKDAVPGG